MPLRTVLPFLSQEKPFFRRFAGALLSDFWLSWRPWNNLKLKHALNMGPGLNSLYSKTALSRPRRDFFSLAVSGPNSYPHLCKTQFESLEGCRFFKEDSWRLPTSWPAGLDVGVLDLLAAAAMRNFKRACDPLFRGFSWVPTPFSVQS